ncbi:laminin subunit alpha-2-like [Mya arenaria]|uniref:laminin subunit alpha-2-like n=1 Tax=Mya arenaria TaxID=6604 RepID=UPI0022E1A730|nr:laminin subunit alpha-2-like [Mya arenaria]
MGFKREILILLSLIGILPELIKGLEINEGETLSLTCPRASRRLPVVWRGPPNLARYTRGLIVDIDLPAELRSRISLNGDHGSGLYNLQIDDARKSDSGEYRCKIGSREIRTVTVRVKTQEEQNQGLFPYILNLATRARISANATCGQDRPEYSCKLAQHVDLNPQVSHCDYCNARAGEGRPTEIGEAHPITNAIDGSNKWWQSPSISNGWEYNYVTITLDLGLIYQVAYVVVKAANSPRPGNWILEKSIDGVKYEPWQFFASTDDDCQRVYNIPALQGKPSYDYLRDDEVRCTSYFSKLNPLENGEIFISLTNGRPGIFVPSKTLLEFTSARYVRLRMQKIRTLNADLMSLQSRDPRNLDPSVTRRYFYSIKDISIGGQCICYGHATECQRQGNSDNLACVCQHNTCGSNCEICCPLYNNKPWVRGGGNGNNRVITYDVNCEECNCHGHANSCVYNETVDALGLSLNMQGEKKGGGVCIDCNDFTTGVNCERCMPGYFRPWGVPHNSPRPCRPCSCEESIGNTGICIEDDSRVGDGLMPGSCICREGFAGQSCDRCAAGYHSYPHCEPCSCSVKGTVDPNMCEGRCVCKENVAGEKCDRCEQGYYDLSAENAQGCRQCFCFGVSTVCQSAGLGLVQITDMRGEMDGWTIITVNDEWFTYFPTPVAGGWLEYRTFPARDQNYVDPDGASEEVIYYWQSPVKYYGNRLASYGGSLHYTMKFTIDESAPVQNHMAEADVILQGGNITITNGRNYIRENQENKKSIILEETEWYKLDSENGRYISSQHVTKKEFMLLLFDLQRILIRATHHTAQDNVMLKEVLLDTSNAGSTNEVTMSGVEKCSCPRGYTGLSCESCDIGWRRLNNVLYGGQCIPCECYGHSKTCDPYTGRCLMCTDNTEGFNCEVCKVGFHGDPTKGNPDDCKPCACPLLESSNNFATTCASSPKFDDPGAFVCLDCAVGYTGERCERCDTGYYGYPGLLGEYCKECQCNGNIDRNMLGSCDQLTGECRICLHNTEGDDCGRCRLGYYGTAMNGDCTLCSCDPFGSLDMTCDRDTGYCKCKEHYTGRQCDRCEDGFTSVNENYWGLESGQGCKPCDCDPIGSYFQQCDSIMGQCRCKHGVTGKKCDICVEGFYGLVSKGECLECKPCDKPGHVCDMDTGECVCPPNTEGERCERCINTYWGYDPRFGCKACGCDKDGSLDNNCDPLTGQCACAADYTGLYCDECLFGFYNFPDCSLCLCSVEGTEPESCSSSGACSCQEPEGQCQCKSNTMGRTCQQCMENSFSLDLHNPDGCTDCFCFGRAESCEQARYVWIKSELPDQSVTFSNRANTMVLRQPSGFHVIPDNVTWTRVIDTQGDPVYWKVPGLTGDMTLSYNGELFFTVEHTNHGDDFSDMEALVDKPLVVIVGYGFPIMFRSEVQWKPDEGMQFSVRLHEHYWRTSRNAEVGRKLMMVILKNVTDIYIRATWDNTAVGARLSDISLDQAVDNELQLGRPALGIEKCECPPKYTGLSCQDPAEGYYRVPNIGELDFTDLTGVIGDVRKCECNGHSERCHPETGVCYDCDHNTSGDNCDMCADSYYGNATQGTANACQRCACPLKRKTNNFSPTCVLVDNDLVCTACEMGYDGTRCQYCAEGYYGDPSTPGEKCEPCGCNPEGSVTPQCDYRGVCVCLPGIQGEKCDQCQPRYAVEQGQCVSCDVGCTSELMIDMDELEAMLRRLKFDPSNVNISAPIRKLNLIRNETRILSDRLQNLKYAEVLNVQEQLKNLTDEVESTHKRSEGAIIKSNQNKNDGEKLLRDATQIEDTISLREMDVKGLIDDLENIVATTFHNRSGVNVTSSLIEAQRILDDIMARNFDKMSKDARKEHDEAELLSERIHGHFLQLTNTSSAEERVNHVRDAFQDLLEHVEKSVVNSEETQKKVKELRKTLDRTRQHLNDTKALNKTLGKDMEGLAKLIEDADDNIDMAEENVLMVEERLSTLEAAMGPLTEKEKLLRTELPDAATLVDKAKAHADNLTKIAENLARTFDSTRDAAADPMRAANVYNDIVAAINEAEIAAKKAKDDADNATSMMDFDELKQKVADSLQRSMDLRDEAREITDVGIAGLDDDLLQLNDNLDGISDTQLDIIERHQDIAAEIDALPTDTVDRIADVQSTIDKAEDTANRVRSDTDKMVDRVNNEMMPKLEELQGIVGGKFDDIYTTMDGTKQKIDELNNLTKGIDTRISQSSRMRSDLRDKLSKLKQSIREAREEANKVKTSLSADGKCVKKFRSMTQPGTINSISFAFKTTKPNQDMMMVLVQNQGISEGDDEKEFLAVELRDGNVRFSWNAGGGVGSVTDNKKVISETSVIKESEKWYNVKAERIGGLGRLIVHRLSEPAGAPLTNTSKVGFSLMALSEQTNVYASGVPDSVVIDKVLTKRNFSGCMGSMYIDETLVGLFNFETNTMDSCTACLEVPSQPPGANVYFFDGSGYAVTNRNSIKSNLVANIIFNFKTYWDNASIFFVGNPETGEYMALELENGHVVFKYYLGQGSLGQLQTVMKYNRNQWVSVAAARSGLMGLLEVGTEQLISEGPRGDTLLDVSKNDLYYGGIPPSVNMDVFQKASGGLVSSERFLGCMSGLQISVDSVNLWEGKSTVGVSEGCRESGLRSIGFYGSGFAEYQGVSMVAQESDLSISFSTMEPDALLLLAKNVNGDSFYSLALKGGLVIGQFNGGGNNPLMLSSTERYNDGKVHNVAVRKTDRKLELYVDDTMVATDRLQRRFSDIAVREDGGLYLGGVPDGLKVDDQAATSKSLDGCISDVVINRVILNINQPKQYDRADIGRCAQRGGANDNGLLLPEERLASDAPANIRMAEEIPLAPVIKPTKQSKTKPEEKMASDMAVPATEGPTPCAKLDNDFKFETDAFTFGETEVSFHQVNVSRKEISRKFRISLDFRTYFQNGVLFYLSNRDHKQFLTAQLVEGNIQLVYSRKDEVKEVKLKTDASLSDGQWHSVVVDKKNQRISVYVDGDEKHERGGKIAKALKVDPPLFVGGLPDNFLPLVNDQVVATSMRGCLRNLLVENDVKTFKDSTLVSGVDRCYANVEKGAYFNKYAYGVYANNFNIGSDFSLEIEFRTSQPKGILTAITSQNGRNAMGLELVNGQVKFKAINRGGEISIKSEYGLCDNVWHKVKVTVMENSISLQVDDGEILKDFTANDVKNMKTKSALYIGGVPDSESPEVLSTNKNFEGCLRSVKINNSPLDWFNLERSVEIQKTACPVA